MKEETGWKKKKEKKEIMVIMRLRWKHTYNIFTRVFPKYCHVSVGVYLDYFH